MMWLGLWFGFKEIGQAIAAAQERDDGIITYISGNGEKIVIDVRNMVVLKQQLSEHLVWGAGRRERGF